VPPQRFSERIQEAPAACRTRTGGSAGVARLHVRARQRRCAGPGPGRALVLIRGGAGTRRRAVSAGSALRQGPWRAPECRHRLQMAQSRGGPGAAAGARLLRENPRCGGDEAGRDTARAGAMARDELDAEANTITTDSANRTAARSAWTTTRDPRHP